MYGYSLWIVLSESTCDYDVGGLDEKTEQLRSLITQQLRARPENPINDVNCQRIFQCSVGCNHRSDDHERLLRILHWITKHLPGSYGLVYWYDDEDKNSKIAEAYQVLVLARGQITERCDPFLSPIVPTVEDG